MARDHRFRDLVRLKPAVVLYAITRPSCEDAGPHDFAPHGSSRDGKSPHMQVIVGVVMVAGGPIAPQVGEGNRVDHSTVPEVINDRRNRVEFGRVVFVGDRGMVTNENIKSITNDNQGFLVGIKRRRHPKLDAWRDAVDDPKWIDCPGGINAQERKTDPLRTHVQEVPSGSPDLRVFVIDSDERRGDEPAKREPALEQTRPQLEKLKERIASGAWKRPAKSGAAVARVLQQDHGDRSFDWTRDDGSLASTASKTQLGRDKRSEGKSGITTREKGLRVLDAVALSKELTDVERGFRPLKDGMAMRPISHQVESRVRAPIFVVARALLVQRLLGRRLPEAGVDLSPERALPAVSPVRLVAFRREGPVERRGRTGGCPDARLVLKALKLVDQRPPAPPEGEETVM